MASLMLCLLILVINCANALNETTVETKVETTSTTTTTTTTTKTPVQEIFATEGLSETLICDDAASTPTHCNFHHPKLNGCYWQTSETTCFRNDNIQGKLDQHCSVVISRVALEDQGTWECNSSATPKKNFNVTVEPAKVLLKLDGQDVSKVSMTLGQQTSQVLNCSLENYELSELTFSWTKTVQGKPDVDLGITDHSLALNELDLKFQDVGQKIQCLVQLKNTPNAQKRESQEIELDLQFPPQTTDYEVRYTTRDNTDNPSFRTNMKILLWANPKPIEAKWTVDTATNYTVEPRQITKGRWSIAVPANVESAKFILETKNSLGKARYTFEGSHSAIELVAPPTNLTLEIDGKETGKLTEINWNREHNITASCHVVHSVSTSKYTIFYKWTLDGKVINEGTSPSISIPLQPANNGNILKCDISYQDQAFDPDKVGKTSTYTVLSINYNPVVNIKFTNGSALQNDQIIHLKLDKGFVSLNLECSTKGYHGNENWVWYRGDQEAQRGSSKINLILTTQDQDQIIKCQVSDEDHAQVRVNLTFKPQEFECSSCEILDDRYEATISMTFMAEPKPTEAIWIIDDIIVPMNHSIDQFRSSELIPNGDKFEIQLTFPMKKSMNNQTYLLNVTNDLGMTSYEWKMQIHHSKQAMSSVLSVSLVIIGLFILVLIYFSVCRNSGVGSGIRRVFSYIADQCSEIKDYYTPEALNLEIQRQSLGVFTLERESQQFANYNPDPDTVTMISMDSEPGVVTHRSGFSDVPLN